VALSDDQRALLRLLARREEGYEDIAALKGKSVAEVREEVRAALDELDAPAAEPPPPPAPREEPSAVPPPPPVEDPPAAPLGAAPRASGLSRGERSEASASSRGESSRPVSRGAARLPRPAALPAERRRLLLLTGGALGAVAVVLLAILLLGGDSDSGSDGAGAGTGAAESVAAGAEGKVTQAVLEPVAGGSAEGRAIFGRLGKEVVLQVTAEGLDPTAPGESYTVWLYRTQRLALRVGSVTVDSSGRLGARFPIPAELLAYVAAGAFNQIYVSRTSDAAFRQEVARARRNQTLPRYSGESVMSGEITGPVVKGSGPEGG
jgi:hypothetical protein